jgi:hypothetical protein
VSVDWVTVACGVLFVLWAVWVPGQLRGIRDRLAERGGDVERFERFRRATLMRAAPPVFAALGLLLVITGLFLS